MKKMFKLPANDYDPTFLKALACAIQCEVLDPSELEYWFDKERSQEWIAKTLYKRFKKETDKDYD